VHPDLDYTGSVLGAARDADVLLLLTEWPEFSTADPQVLAKTVARPAVVDARHALDAATWRACGWDYRAPGRPGAAGPLAASNGPGAAWPWTAGDGPCAGDNGAPDSGAPDSVTRDAGDGGISGTGDAERVRVEVACLAAAS
jgi:hypothetical protein